jgi:hypothetical protein
MPHSRSILLVTAMAVIALLPTLAAHASSRPVVVELFTSQGCSSCPPADALLAELARRDDVLALGFHVTHWDRLGWKDPLSSPPATERQRDYARRFNGGQLYTPQMVIDGVDEMVGSDRGAVLAAVQVAQPKTLAPVSFAADRHSVTVGATGAGVAEGQVLLVRFAEHRTTHVGAGENSGKVAEDSHAVETLTLLGAWNGEQHEFPISPPGPGEGLAVLVQASDGHMLGDAAVISQE